MRTGRCPRRGLSDYVYVPPYQRKPNKHNKEGKNEEGKEEGKKDEEDEVQEGVDEGGRFRVVQLDRSGLYNPTQPVTAGEGHEVCERLQRERGELTAAGKELAMSVLMRGPISVGEWMRTCLLHPTYGYYTQNDDAIFGGAGDFITSPEISQMFGELVGIWCVATWQLLGCPPAVQLVEIGGGRGTLMADVLRASRVVPEFKAALRVAMVEPSPSLRSKQAATLGCDVTRILSNDSDQDGLVCREGVAVQWFTELDGVADSAPSIVICHELFDALPTHQFEKDRTGWAERYVDVDPQGKSHFRQVLVKGSPMCGILADRGVLKADAPTGTVVEYSPDAVKLTQQLCHRLSTHPGAVLIMDYAAAENTRGSLRGILHHQFVSITERPGEVDLSVDVDFATIASSARESGCNVFGPIEQGEFLEQLGIRTRLERLQASCTKQQADALQAAYDRLTQPHQMGKVYKAMAIMSAEAGPHAVAFPDADADAHSDPDPAD